jgi:hypothetical protein
MGWYNALMQNEDAPNLGYSGFGEQPPLEAMDTPPALDATTASHSEVEDTPSDTTATTTLEAAVVTSRAQEYLVGFTIGSIGSIAAGVGGVALAIAKVEHADYITPLAGLVVLAGVALSMGSRIKRTPNKPE